MEFGADGAAQLGSQLDQRLGTPLRLPDLSQKGFSLVGGRFLPGAGGATAQLVYRDKGGRLITLFLGGRAEPQARGGDRQPVGLYTWLDGSLNVAVVGGVGGDELSSIAEAAQRSLMSAEPPPVKTERPPQPQPQNRPPDASKT
jgi:anti-sigma factor RsiW